MSDRFKEIDIKYCTYYFSDDMMHIKNLVLNKIKIKSQKKKKKNPIYYIGTLEMWRSKALAMKKLIV